ncbi:MAG: PSD1 and planctomycete cytochrome C domain-containing protein [Gemmataceae bacterium]|nr:PSD1 and planctomycete cytochrome C domain-containing protein [Gemmataceae bacterium]
MLTRVILAFVLVAAGSVVPAKASVEVPGGTVINTVDFERHVMGLFGRAGCNAGSCHGSFQGKGGFRLSLFGFEPAKDFYAVTRDSMGRRINPADPDASLLLLKATGQVEHAGGVRFSKGSWQYQILREWIAAGAPWSKGSGDVAQVILNHQEIVFGKADEIRQVQVRVRFTDGTEADLTAFCDFRTNDDAVADVTPLGVVRSIRPGSTAIVVSYRGQVLPVRVMVPMELPAGYVYPAIPEVNYVDREVFSRLKKLNMVPSELCSDAEFLRRVTIDTTGQLPSPEEVRAFLANPDPHKRAKKIDELLCHPLHAAMWATKFCDITGNDTQSLEGQAPLLKAKRSQQWYEWLRKRFAENMPYDEIVRGILCATSREGMSPEEWIEHVRKIDEQTEEGFDTDYAQRKTLDLYWRRQQNVSIELWGERTAAAFLGVRVECAQCHKHPFDRWSQVEYRAYANIFSAVALGNSPEAGKLIAAENMARKAKAADKKKNQLNLVRELYVAKTAKTLPHPETGQALGAKALGGPDIPFRSDKDMREALFEWMRSPDNPFFARAFVNRVWGHYFGIGIVQPVDDFSLGNPPSNDKLLDALAQDFINHRFDIRHIERVILNSRTYQLSSKANETNKYDKVNFARSYIRPLMAEAVVDVLNSALGTVEKWGPEIKPGSKAVEVGASQLQNQQLAYAFRIFGRPPRTSACDCERTMEPALPQKLFLMTDVGLLDKFRDPNGTGRLQSLLKSNKNDMEILDELFLATLSRYPTERDRQAFLEYRKMVPDRRAAFVDTVWALINTREFILNH